ncbi:hypothetical protein L226DRAFT_535159 [Lentinus tigrinus ALCF2SS1-7]|uniref:uncharacterized protein n=1 Tax=Lentinus tigrinus ALCF2SS1-7 TaxID=1328758 RepID=UPI0011662639|nr:hypothetical protein L226DRAFT_535159 [Lentinus tigrinus ALCF2SS1-7]
MALLLIVALPPQPRPSGALSPPALLIVDLVSLPCSLATVFLVRGARRPPWYDVASISPGCLVTHLDPAHMSLERVTHRGSAFIPRSLLPHQHPFSRASYPRCGEP